MALCRWDRCAKMVSFADLVAAWPRKLRRVFSTNVDVRCLEKILRTQVSLNGIHFGGIKQCKYMVSLRDKGI